MSAEQRPDLRATEHRVENETQDRDAGYRPLHRFCGGGDDFTPTQIGFGTTCPDVTPPGASSCAGAITTLQDLVNCVDCVTEFEVDCAVSVAVPALAAYPTECNP